MNCQNPAQAPSLPVQARTSFDALGHQSAAEYGRAPFAVAEPAHPFDCPTDVSATIGAGATSGDLFVEFPDDGMVVSFVADVVDPQSMGTPLDPRVARTIAGVMVQNTRTRAYLYGDQRSEKMVTIAARFGPDLTRTHMLNEPVRKGDRWRVKFQNLTSANNNLKCIGVFGFSPAPRG